MTAIGADPPPQFTAAGVAGGSQPARKVVPGAFLTIYGEHLGPAQTQCIPPAGSPRPTMLCDTQVLVGYETADLLYVSNTQINLRVPDDAPKDGTVELRVIYNGQSSLPVTVTAGLEQTTVSLDGPAYAGMPVWLKVEAPSQFASIRYPFTLGPADFGCNQVEMRRDGRMLPMQPGSDWARYGITISGFICGSISLDRQVSGGRLPIHLLYRLDPGVYEVRYTLRSGPAGITAPGPEIRVQSEWTRIEILPARPNQRAEWLQSIRERDPSDPAELLTDVLPSLMGVADDASFEILSGYLYHADDSVRKFAANGLFYWPDAYVRGRLEALRQRRGTSDVLTWFLSHQ